MTGSFDFGPDRSDRLAKVIGKLHPRAMAQS
jgi:hypothetical protein